MDKESSFNFFSIIPAPAFDNNITYWPEIDISNVAISQDGPKYTILSSEEFSRCMDIPPICKTARALMPTINQGSCVVSTYKTGTQTCPLKPSSSSPPEPFLYFVDTNLYYSVPSNTTLFVTCLADNQFLSTKETTINPKRKQPFVMQSVVMTTPSFEEKKAVISCSNVFFVFLFVRKNRK